MYDRQERIFTFQGTNVTDENVGPGSYSPREIKCDRYEIGYAPFNSLAERKFDFARPDADNLPAPWEYKPERLPNRIKGCSTVSDRAARFPSFRSHGPGPDAYVITSSWAGKKPGPCGLMIPRSLLKTAEDDSAATQKQPTCDRVNYVRFRDVPSIPSGNFVHGYEEGPDGRLRPQKGPHKDETLGPAFYGPTNIPTFTQYRGCGWSRLTSQRQPLHNSVHKVGPGQYEPFTDVWEKIVQTGRERDCIQSQNPLNVPRFIEKVVQEVNKLKFPSPATYVLPDTLLKSTVRRGPNGAVIQLAPFNVEAQRFKEDNGDTPGPNVYEFSHKWPKVYSKTPFNTAADRFKTALFRGPAPNAYKPQISFTDELTKRVSCSTVYGNKIPFNSTAKRFKEETTIHQLSSKTPTVGPESTPGPGHYATESYGEVGHTSTKGCGLGTEKREEKPVLSCAPPPGTYDVAKSFDASQTKRPPAPAQTLEGQERRGAFLVSSERFDKQSCLSARDPNLPGPSDYCISRDLNDKMGKFVFQSERFKPATMDPTPGPADYKIAPAVESCLRLDTFNVTLPGKTLLLSNQATNSVLKGTFNATLINPYSMPEQIAEPPTVRVT
ncbi:Sperm-tail PG-rich repeat-containing protein 2 [Paragonimus heterotremus]|uniref:Sperm-tail PG-rich repeat-containing protein 2 n=1 Tax=Paragonimus heterotremus TaxID=100268 RepID=A0A8J4WLY6_9TREM|nr:Sperm-tail PG-rich repeat-containing protein 2 [Paragonimus heterotremus]